MKKLTNLSSEMSSREIAELTGKQHKNVKRDIENMIEELELDRLTFERIYFDSMNRQQNEYALDHDMTVCLTSGYSAKQRMVIIKRWRELESGKNQKQVSLPSTKQLALMVLAAEEEKEKALLLVEQKSQHIESLESLFHNGGTIAQFVKQLNGVNSQKVNTWLNDNTKWLYDENKGKVNKYGMPKSYSWRCASYARDKYLTESPLGISRQGMNLFTKYEVRLLADGKKWLFDKYVSGKLPMKADWNGKYTHEKDLS